MELQGKRGQRWRKRQNSQENLAKWKENTKKRRKTHGKPKKRKKIQKKNKKNSKINLPPLFFRFPTVRFCRWWFFCFSFRPLWVPMQTTMILYQSWELWSWEVCCDNWSCEGGSEFILLVDAFGRWKRGDTTQPRTRRKKSPEPLGYHRVFERHL